VRPFVNEPPLELRRADVRAGLAEELSAVDAAGPLRVAPWIGSERGEAEGIVSTDPGEPERVVATAGRAGAAEAHAAVERAALGCRSWSAVGAAGRAAVLVRAAAWMRERRVRLAALAVRECAKPWPEADADVCEAIDFLEYYARAAIDLDAGRPLAQPPGERNTLRYAPRGVCAVISPWNFPLAIPCGMTAAALATGNSVVLKPAEQSPGCASMLAHALRESGVPDDALALLPGEGEAGAALVRHPGVHTIAFTGSQPVGLEILRAAAEVPEGQGHLKRVVAEMGGKNCVLVDSDADLDEAVPGLVASAFGYAGQKCSAASRALVHEAIADALLERLAGAVKSLVVGQAAEAGTDVPPLIEAAARDRVAAYARLAASEGEIAARGDDGPASAGGWFHAPVLATGLAAGSRVLAEEIFGPLLTVEAVPSIEAACEIVDSLPFALTGGLYARDPRTVEMVAARTPVGNLYVNRATTGAVVDRQPFGGNRLSGTGTKAGGPDYLLSFVEPRAVTENTVRHGLVV